MKHIKEFDSFLNEEKGEQLKNKWDADEYWDMSIIGDDVDLLNTFMEDNNASPDDVAFVNVTMKSQSQVKQMTKELEIANLPYIDWHNADDDEDYLVFVVD